MRALSGWANGACSRTRVARRAIPHNDKEGISAGGMSVGISVRHDEKVSPIISAVMILGGVGLMIAGRATK